jgi:3',5'-cyclic AMP phosphodiesterase CpdA
MRTLVHLSDLHFGRIDAALLDPLVASVHDVAPDVVVVSGDLTQRARRSQFAAARAFLARMPGPQVVVPGNHDVPLWNVFARMLRPLENYKRYIGPELQPSFVDAELAVVGVNTARSLVVKNGRINREQLRALRATLAALPDDVVKVVVTHHPFDVGEGDDFDQRVGRADLAMATFARCGVDVLLAGHLHASRSGDSGDRYALDGYEALVVAAGTATSTRGRGEANSFNVLRVEPDRIEVDRWAWNEAAFAPASTCRYRREARGWAPA